MYGALTFEIVSCNLQMSAVVVSDAAYMSDGESDDDEFFFILVATVSALAAIIARPAIRNRFYLTRSALRQPAASPWYAILHCPDPRKRDQAFLTNCGVCYTYVQHFDITVNCGVIC